MSINKKVLSKFFLKIKIIFLQYFYGIAEQRKIDQAARRIQKVVKFTSGQYNALDKVELCAKIKVGEDETVEVGAVLAIVGSGAAAPAAQAPAAPEKPAEQPAQKPAAQEAPAAPQAPSQPSSA